MGCVPSASVQQDYVASKSKKESNANYVVIVDVRQARHVKKMDFLSQSDTYIKVKIDGQEKKTRVFGNSKKPVWNTTFKFTFVDKPAQIDFVAMDKDTFSADDLIGIHSAKLADYWERKNDVTEWVPLLSKPKNGEVAEKVGELLIKIQAAAITEQLRQATSHYDYTHLLELKLVGAKNLKRMDYVGHNNSYLVVSWADREIRTDIANGANPLWNTTAFFWASQETQKHYNIKITVMDKDVNKDDEVGTCFVPAAGLFANEGKGIDQPFPIRPSKVITDKDLADLDKLNHDNNNVVGEVTIVARLIPKEEIEKEFFAKFLAEFDSDNDGVLCREEVAGMIAALGVDMTDQEFDEFWSSIDLDQSDEVSQDEALLLLRSLVFRSVESANRILHFLTGGIDALSNELIQSVPRHQNGSEINVMDRDTGIIVKENIPTYIKVAMKSMFTNKAGRFVITSKRSVKLLHNMSVKQGVKFDNPKSAAEIPAFIKLHNLNVNEIERPLDDFKTFNEFFFRALKPEARPIDSPNDASIAVNPADSRMMVFPDIQDATRFWIKGDEFNLENLLGPQLAPELAARYASGSLVIARLAPQDYHRWHIPVNGRLGRRVKIAGALFTVNPYAINQNVNVYTQNKREVCELDSDEFGKVLVIAVGATMVGSINIISKDHAAVKKGDTHGYFAFGGSTVLLLFEPNRIVFDKDLLANSSKKIETLVRVNTSMGRLMK